MLLDAHVHINEYAEDLDTALHQIRTNHIFTLAVSMDPESYARTKEIAANGDYIVPSFGIHPWKAPDFYDKLNTLDPLVKEAPMIGEIGLDHRFVDDPSTFPHQEKVVEYFLKAAARQHKIVNLHTSGAEKQVVEMLEKYKVTHSIVHWYNGPLELVERYLSAGAWFTIGVELMFSRKIKDVLDAIPNNRLLTETDNPGGYQWLTKKTGSPDLIRNVTSGIARHKNMDVDEVISLVSTNFESLIAHDPSLIKKWNTLNESARN